MTAIEFNLLPISEVYAGILWFPVERGEVLNAWRCAGRRRAGRDDVGRPDPPVPADPRDPEPVRGRSFAVVQAIWLGDEAEGARLLEPLWALGPAMDTHATIPMTALSKLHMDPEGLAPGAGDGQLLDTIDRDVVDRPWSTRSARRSFS